MTSPKKNESNFFFFCETTITTIIDKEHRIELLKIRDLPSLTVKMIAGGDETKISLAAEEKVIVPATCLTFRK